MPSGALSCPICYNDYDQTDHKPRIIQECGHTICSTCLSMILLNKTDSAKCPLDNGKFSNLDRTVDCFPINFTVQQLLDEKASRDLCDVHKDKLRLVCLTDRSDICDACVFDGDHKGHDVRPVKKLRCDADQKKAELELMLKSFQRFGEEIKEVVDEKRNNLITVIKEKFQELRWLMTKKELELLFEVNSMFDVEFTTTWDAIGPNQDTIDSIKNRMRILDGIHTPKEYFHAIDKNVFQEASKVDLDQINHQCQSLDKKLNVITLQLHENLLSQLDSFAKINLSLENLTDETTEIPTEIPTEDVTDKIDGLSYSEKILTRLEELIQIDIRDDWLVISTEKDAVRDFCHTSISVRDTEWTSRDKIWLKLGKCASMTQCVQTLARVWKNCTEVTSVKIEFTSTEITDEELLGVFSVIFAGNNRFKDIAVNLSDCKVSDQSVSPFVEEILPKMSKLKSLSLNLNATKISNKSLESFAKCMKPTMRVLESFDIRLCEINFSDEHISQLFAKMDRVKKFTLDLGYTQATNACLQTLATVALPSMKILEEFKLGLTSTKVTDEGIIQVLSGMVTAKHLLLYLHGTSITDKSFEFFASSTLPTLPNLEILEMRLGDTKISDQSMIKLLDNELKKVRRFILKLQSTKISDKTAEKLVHTVYPAMKNLEEFEVDISGTNISEKFAVEFMRLKERSRI